MDLKVNYVIHLENRKIYASFSGFIAIFHKTHDDFIHWYKV